MYMLFNNTNNFPWKFVYKKQSFTVTGKPAETVPQAFP